MSFLYPAFLFALVALAIPVIIHFFNFRKYKTLYFSNVSLLKLIKQESKKKSRLKQLIMLAARLLAVACLVFAFSRPYLPLNNRGSQAAQKVVAIYIDNTFSMKNVNEKGQLLEQAKLKAIEAANSYRQGAQFILLTSDFLPQHQYVLTREQFIQQVSEIKESPRTPLFSEVYGQAAKSVADGPKKADRIVYFLSDFQKNSTDMEALQRDSSLWSYLLPFKAEKTNNLLIDSCWFEVPVRRIGQQEKLFVHLENLSDQAYQNIPIRLNINDSLRAISNVSIAGRQDTIVELSYTNNSDGIQLCKVELDDYPIIYDNTWFMSYKVRGRMKALGIFNPTNNTSDYLQALFSEDDLVSYDEFPENNVQIGQLKVYQCIFLLGTEHISSGLKSELISFVEQGGSLVLIPARNGNTEDFNALLAGLNGHLMAAYDTSSMGISEINYSHALYNEVFKKQEANADLPLIHGFYRFTEQISKVESPVLKFRNGKNALASFRFGNGQVYSFAFPVDEDNMNFIRHIIFVPTIYNMVLNSEAPRKYVYPIESDEPVILDHALLTEELKLVNHQTGDEFRISARQSGAGRKQVILNDMISQAGHYLIYDGEQAIQSLSYNFPREESDPLFLDAETINDLIGENNHDRMQVIEAADSNFSEVLQDLNNGKQLWKMFIILALLFLFIEMAVARFWK